MSYKMNTRVSWARTRQQMEETFRLWGIVDWQSMSTCEPQQTQSSYLSEEKRRVTVRYMHPSGKEISLSMAKQSRPVDNFRVLYLTVEGMRLNETRGLGEVFQDAYLQLSAPPTEKDPYEILGVRPDAALEICEAAYRQSAKSRHSDKGGTDEAMKEINSAIERIREDRA